MSERQTERISRYNHDTCICYVASQSITFLPIIIAIFLHTEMSTILVGWACFKEMLSP